MTVDAPGVTRPLDPVLRVLAIDDEAFQLKLLARQFALLGVDSVGTYQDGAQALAALAEGAPVDLVCCDLQMPAMDGVQFVRHLAEVGFRGMVLLVSGEDGRILQTAERLARTHGLQVAGALAKPVRPDQLRGVVDAVRVRMSEALQPARQGQAPRRRYDAEAIREAIDLGHLVNHYQPKVELATGRVVGVETLVRWQHPRDGLVYPDQFVDAAESAGLIDDLTRAVLDGPQGALMQARAWQDAGLPLQVAVNVSMDNLTSHGFADMVGNAVARAGIPPSRLVLEVTESRLMRDPLVALDVLTRLRLKRISLSIDDFGTGHSSLAQLRDVPFDELKLDRSFVHGAHARESLHVLVQGCIDMARQLGLKTVAEGVEDLDDLHHLRACGCDLVQGWLIARPMAAGALPGWMAQWPQRQSQLWADTPVA
jgi:EAL domain-containing protein (putative c-di-GMP-specific phosphodiesterase class I)